MGTRIAAIDIGSNAIRLSIGENQRKKIKLLKTERVPLSLGRDVFSSGEIKDSTLQEVLKIFIDFQRLFIEYNVQYYKAVATSALRDAKNNYELIDLVYSTSHIQIDMIDGKEEARLVHLVVSHIENISKKSSLLIDIGGGSVEFLISQKGNLEKILSLPIGTVRLLESSIPKENFNFHLRATIQKQLSPILKYKALLNPSREDALFIGTGGNVKSLNRLTHQLFKGSNKECILIHELEYIEKILFGFSLPERIEKLGLRPDRAQVILPAVLILQETMKAFGFQKIRCPNVGLKDGVLIQISKNL